MAYEYQLICAECRVYLYLGKVYWLDDEGQPLGETTFDGVFEFKAKRWHKRDTYFGRVMEKFFLGHRNHELRFVPEGVDDLLEEGHGGPFQAIEPDELLATPEVEPDADEECKAWRKKLGIKEDSR